MISTIGFRSEYTGNGTLTGPYSFPYYLDSGADLVVALGSVTQSGGFTVTQTVSGDKSAWDVNFTTAPASAVSIVLRRDTDNTQESDYQENGPIPSDTIENDLDKRTAVAQEIEGGFGRGIRFDPNLGGITDLQTLLSAATADTFIGFDSNGYLTLFSGTINGVVTNVVNTGEVDSINSQTGTAYTLALSDAGAVIEMSNSLVNTVTIPPFVDVNLATNTRLDVVQMGTGTTSIAAGAGVTIRGLLNVRAQYHGISLYKRDTNEWVAIGGI